ncbi:hypothetical protein FB466_0205 [Klugiella xanthotipulae]|uniref:Uncharacterized protein n=1 Tax=Klugiella xanthotipulae TaxID=244735 RepID=A0A543I486_9MICO|nr:hypothetical protein FB466_0205 [Klugiella xanthotipulae]
MFGLFARKRNIVYHRGNRNFCGDHAITIGIHDEVSIVVDIAQGLHKNVSLGESNDGKNLH